MDAYSLDDSRALSLASDYTLHVPKEAYNIGFQNEWVFSRCFALPISLMGWLQLAGSIKL